MNETMFDMDALLEYPLNEQIELLKELYVHADSRRYDYGTNSFGDIGDQACRMMAEYIGDATDMPYDSKDREEIMVDAWCGLAEYYPAVYDDIAIVLEKREMR